MKRLGLEIDLKNVLPRKELFHSFWPVRRFWTKNIYLTVRAEYEARLATDIIRRNKKKGKKNFLWLRAPVAGFWFYSVSFFFLLN